VGLKYLKYMDPAAERAQVLRATTKRSSIFWGKSAPSQLLWPPM